MDVPTFNALPTAEAAMLVRPCADIDAFVDAVVDGRPYADLGQALEVAGRQAAAWTGEEVRRALADHPRIGERHEGSGASAAMSVTEQGSVRTVPDTAARLAEGNRRYEERFGRIFLIRAAGRTARDVLEQLEHRLGNDPVAELEVTGRELAEIAVLRLRGVLS